MDQQNEYVPDSADEATSSSDSNSSFVIPKVPQIVVDLSKNKRFYDRDDSKESFRQQNNNKQGSYSQNMSVENINNQYFQEIFPNNESVQIDQNLIIETKNTKNEARTKRLWNKRDYCCFCDTEVLKFSRHVLRHHQQEIEVQQILAYNVRDKRRKALFNKLRNQGNFLKSTVGDNNIVPVRQPTKANLATDVANVSTYLPCKYCKGFYKRKYLYRHVKKCPHNDNKSKKINAQSEGQSLFSTYKDNDLLRKEIFPIMRFSTYKDNDLLRKEIFPIMRADEISYTAKTDPLICAVARRYLRSHRDKQFRLVASRKMRQLAALLNEIKKKKPVKNLLQSLDPANFDIIVECTKIIARFDVKTATYGAPSLASHMGTELKDCIDVGYNMSLKLHHRETEEATKLKALKELITTEWRYEVSTLANNDLKQKQWNKPTLIPLAEDLTLVKKYLLAEAEKLRNALKYEVSTLANNDLKQKQWNKPTLIPLAEDLTLVKKYLLAEAEKLRNALNENPHDLKAFRTLQEICYVQLLLLNRRRIGELQRMTVHSYTSNINNEKSTEFDNCISENERVLMKSFKRVVIRGKRGRGVPVLFTEEIVRTTNLLLKVRANFVQDDNIYLFANTTSSNSISGSTAIYTHVRRAGAKNPAALTSTKLRKHLATMSQVINLTEQDLEQLANFMGHTSEIHKSCYRLPNDLYQMAKVSKLLILNEKGEASKYKGKSLDEIEIDLNIVEDKGKSLDEIEIDLNIVEEENSDHEDDNENNNDNDQEESMLETANENIGINEDDNENNNDNDQEESMLETANENIGINLSKEKKSATSQKKHKRILEPWTEDQKNVTLAFFEKHLKKRNPPKKHECLQLQEENPGLFNNKSWEKIKIFVVNNYVKK
ncbi:hypothetical protein QE152_g36826 [Popillia japonica]|uniref:C2H2-type domain-containing protein n=1 Tax=Popillia japonica TaxID=7064 RepID=A0AAW1ICP4_POPJA